MPTPAAGTATGSPDPSLNAAQSAIQGLLFPEKKKTPASATPEPPSGTEQQGDEPPAEEEEESAEGQEGSEEAPPPEGEESEVPEGQEEEESAPAPKYRVKVDGKEEEVTLDELKSGYSRHKDYSTKTMALAAEKKAFEEKEVAAVRAERQQYADNLGKLSEVLKDAVGKEPDWEKLRQTVTPAEFAQEYVLWQQGQEKIKLVEKEQERVKAVQAEDARKQLGEYVKGENAKLLETFPEWKDDAKKAAASKEMIDYARKLGYTDQELVHVYDSRLITTLHKAMLYDKAKQKAPVLQNKVDRAIAAASPGSSVPRPKQSKLAVAKGKLAKSGSEADAAAAIELLI